MKPVSSAFVTPHYIQYIIRELHVLFSHALTCYMNYGLIRIAEVHTLMRSARSFGRVSLKLLGSGKIAALTTRGSGGASMAEKATRKSLTSLGVRRAALSMTYCSTSASTALAGLRITDPDYEQCSTTRTVAKPPTQITQYIALTSTFGRHQGRLQNKLWRRWARAEERVKEKNADVERGRQGL
jgi:hypothetical protein